MLIIMKSEKDFFVSTWKKKMAFLITSSVRVQECKPAAGCFRSARGGGGCCSADHCERFPPAVGGGGDDAGSARCSNKILWTMVTCQ